QAETFVYEVDFFYWMLDQRFRAIPSKGTLTEPGHRWKCSTVWTDFVPIRRVRTTQLRCIYIFVGIGTCFRVHSWLASHRDRKRGASRTIKFAANEAGDRL